MSKWLFRLILNAKDGDYAKIAQLLAVCFPNGW